MPGTTPDYWMTTDDRITATMLSLLESRAERASGKGAPGKRPRPDQAARARRGR